MSPWGLVTEKETFIMGRKHISYDVGGITQLDYLNLYKKFTYKAQESYRLDYIASVELGQKKLDHSEFDTFKDFYTNGWQKFVEYNIIDVELVDRMEDKMKLIELAITMAYDAKVNFVDVFYQVRMWDAIIYNYLKKRNIVIPQRRILPKVKNTQAHMSRNRFLESMTGWCLLTLILSILISLCNTTSPRRLSLMRDIHRQVLNVFLMKR